MQMIYASLLCKIIVKYEYTININKLLNKFFNSYEIFRLDNNLKQYFCISLVYVILINLLIERTVMIAFSPLIIVRRLS